MHPVMQQTNVIHVAQGGTVILPGQSQSTQVNHVNQQVNPQVNQARSHKKHKKKIFGYFFRFVFLQGLDFLTVF